MPAFSRGQIADLLAPYESNTTSLLLDQLSTYLDLLLKWNARTNLSAIRAPEQIVRRHFGESLFVARHLPIFAENLLDLGSGAGFPGLPIQLARPYLTVVVAESQNKKASFLREVVRTLGLPTEVWADRVELLPESRCFDVVTLRAVDRPEHALQLGRRRLRQGGMIAHLTTSGDPLQGVNGLLVPGGGRSVLHLMR